MKKFWNLCLATGLIRRLSLLLIWLFICAMTMFFLVRAYHQVIFTQENQVYFYVTSIFVAGFVYLFLDAVLGDALTGLREWKYRTDKHYKVYISLLKKWKNSKGARNEETTLLLAAEIYDLCAEYNIFGRLLLKKKKSLKRRDDWLFRKDIREEVKKINAQIRNINKKLSRLNESYSQIFLEQ
jgi:hypothetical protein